MNPFETFAETWRSYRRAGWEGTLRFRPGTKWPPPKGFTGYDGKMPTEAQCAAWGPSTQLGLRVPRGVVGLDLDAYDGRQGLASAAALTAQFGPLPPTLHSTSRTDGSGIYFFRVPDDVLLIDDTETINFPDIQIVQYHHRYAMVWPSIHPDTKQQYRWHRGSQVVTTIPTVDDLPELPTRWIEGLRAQARTRDVGPDSTGEYKPIGQWEHQREAWRVHARELLIKTRDEWDAHGRAGTYSQRRNLYWQAHALSLDLELEDILTELGIDPDSKEQDLISTGCRAPVDVPRPDDEFDLLGTWTGPKPKSFPAGQYLPGSFWEERKYLTYIRDAARAAQAAPDAVLGIAMARQSSYWGVYDTVDGEWGKGPTAMTVFTAIVAPSGIGKGTSSRVAKQLFPVPEHLRPDEDGSVDIYNRRHKELPLGSGQGMVEAYFNRVKSEGDKAPVKKRTSDNVLFKMDEGWKLTKRLDQSGDSTGDNIRSMWNVEHVGDANASDDRQRDLPDNSYRIGLYLLFQRNTVRGLLTEDQMLAGTPQRFIYLRGDDPSAPDGLPAPPSDDFVLPDPGAMQGLKGRAPVQVRLDVEDVKRDQRQLGLDAHRGKATPDGSHTGLMTLRIAGMFAVWENRKEINAVDWALAECVVKTSTQVRDVLVHEANADAAQQQKFKRDSFVQTAVAVEDAKDVRETQRTDRIARVYVRYIRGHGPSGNDALSKASSRDKKYRDDAIEYAVEQNWIMKDNFKWVLGPAAGEVE